MMIEIVKIFLSYSIVIISINKIHSIDDGACCNKDEDILFIAAR